MASARQRFLTRNPIQLSDRIQNHMTRMAFRDAERYAQWCGQHGFAFAYDKTWRDLELEWQEHCRDFARARAQSRVPRAVPDVLAVVEAVLRTRLGLDLDHDAFWLTVLRFLIESDFPLRRAPVLVAYLHARKFVPEEIYRDGRLHARCDPPQQHLSMAGRRTASLLAQIDDWYRGVRNDGAPSVWAASGRRGFERQLEGHGRPTVWRLRELLSSHELLEEARVMRSCVASYAQYCIRGRTSLWSLEEETPTHIRKRLTIELNGDRILQCRGPANRLPRPEDREIVRAWAAQEGLHIADPAFDP